LNTHQRYDDTYLTTLHLREKFLQLKNFLSINEKPKAEVEKIENLKSAITKLSEELTQQKTITEAVSEENLGLKKRIDRTERKLAEIEKTIREYRASRE
jgi:septal ring factor EnvC (AmiA/AmiB activator)